MFDDFFNGFGGRASRSLGPWQGVTPTMDLTENEKEIVVTAEIPGLDDKDFEVTVAGDLLTLRGEKKVEQGHRNGDAYYVERRFGAFSRSVRLPFEVKDEKVDARYDAAQFRQSSPIQRCRTSSSVSSARTPAHSW
jgi:HSP20 family protein